MSTPESSTSPRTRTCRGIFFSAGLPRLLVEGVDFRIQMRPGLCRGFPQERCRLEPAGIVQGTGLDRPELRVARQRAEQGRAAFGAELARHLVAAFAFDGIDLH